MRRAILIIPHWLSAPDHPSFVRSRTPLLHQFAEHGELSKCSPMPLDPVFESSEGAQAGLTPEAAWLGLDPSSLKLQDGPLTVSALGADPPENSVQFHLSLLSYDDGAANWVKPRLGSTELTTILEASKKLCTKFLTVVGGEETEHALVWENGSIELGTTPARNLVGKPVREFLPEGDGETQLRRFIDDSINLLSDLEVNRRRIDEGQAPANLWWPWGQGFRASIPNLALRRGEVAWVQSSSMRLQGLTRLAGYRHEPRNSFGYATKTNFERIVEGIRSHNTTISYIDAFSVFREYHRWEEADWLSGELDRRLLLPLRDLGLREPLHITIVTCGGWTGSPGPNTASAEGLVLNYDSKRTCSNSIPPDERALDEKLLARTNAWEAINEALIS